MTRNKPYIVALTGSIATGKSEASSFIKSMGLKVIDFDKLGHEILSKDSLTKSELVKEFGNSILDEFDTIDRKKLGRIVFNDNNKRLKLNKITHTRIYNLALEEIIEAKDEVIFLDIPLLFETRDQHKDFYKVVDEIWLISSTTEIQLFRLMKRDGITKEDAIKRIESQMNILEKKQLSDLVIENINGIDSLHKKLIVELDDLEKRVKKDEN